MHLHQNDGDPTTLQRCVETWTSLLAQPRSLSDWRSTAIALRDVYRRTVALSPRVDGNVLDAMIERATAREATAAHLPFLQMSRNRLLVERAARTASQPTIVARVVRAGIMIRHGLLTVEHINGAPVALRLKPALSRRLTLEVMSINGDVPRLARDDYAALVAQSEMATLTTSGSLVVRVGTTAVTLPARKAPTRWRVQAFLTNRRLKVVAVKLEPRRSKRPR